MSVGLCNIQTLLGKNSVKTFPRQERIVGGVVSCAVRVVSKKSRQLFLPRTSFYLIINTLLELPTASVINIEGNKFVQLLCNTYVWCLLHNPNSHRPTPFRDQPLQTTTYERNDRWSVSRSFNGLALKCRINFRISIKRFSTHIIAVDIYSQSFCDCYWRVVHARDYQHHSTSTVVPSAAWAGHSVWRCYNAIKTSKLSKFARGEAGRSV
jgi:hypothetical protein